MTKPIPALPYRYAHSLKEIVKQPASFQFLCDNYAYYKIWVPATVKNPEGRGYEIPIPLNDVGGATLNREEKGITLMRWIRKAMETQTMRATLIL